jgi:hypothetical protein
MFLMPKDGKWDESLRVAALPYEDGGAPMSVASSRWLNIVLQTFTPAPQLVWWLDTVENLCQATLSRVDLKAQIAREKANPSGVVDLKRLHDLGEALQSAEDTLRGYGASYAKGMGKPFSAAATCPGT